MISTFLKIGLKSNPVNVPLSFEKQDNSMQESCLTHSNVTLPVKSGNSVGNATSVISMGVGHSLVTGNKGVRFH